MSGSGKTNDPGYIYGQIPGEKCDQKALLSQCTIPSRGQRMPLYWSARRCSFYGLAFLFNVIRGISLSQKSMKSLAGLASSKCFM